MEHGDDDVPPSVARPSCPAPGWPWEWLAAESRTHRGGAAGDARYVPWCLALILVPVPGSLAAGRPPTDGSSLAVWGKASRRWWVSAEAIIGRSAGKFRRAEESRDLRVLGLQGLSLVSHPAALG